MWGGGAVLKMLHLIHTRTLLYFFIFLFFFFLRSLYPDWENTGNLPVNF